MSTRVLPDEELQSQVESWYLGKKKYFNRYSYTPEGDLMEVDKEGNLVNVISLPNYRPPTFEEREEVEAIRREQIAEAEATFIEKREELRIAIESGESTPGEIVRLNRAVYESDQALQMAKFPLKYIQQIKRIPQNQIHLDDPYETRQLNSVTILLRRPFTLEDEYVRIGEKVVEEEVKPKKIKRRRRPIILFKLPDTNEHGFMSLEYPVNFDVRGTTYRSAKHALYGELAKAFDDDAMFERIQATEDPALINFTNEDYKDVELDAWNMKRSELIQEITLEKFKQQPELAEQLVLTGDARLGADIMGDTILGIGLSIENPEAREYKKWTGQNLLGQSLEMARAEIKRIRESTVAQPVVPQAVTDAVSTAVDAVTSLVAPATEAVTSLVAPATEAVASLVAPAQPAPTKRTLRISRKPL